MAKKVFDGWIPRHGAPEQLHHDLGKNLCAKMIQEVCTERSIRTVNNMLAKVVTEDQRNWDISSTCFAYNTAVHSSTGFTPSYLEFGTGLRLPNRDLVEPEQAKEKDSSHTEYATQLKSRLIKAFECAKEVLSSSHKIQKDFYDRWAKAKTYKKGDLVLWKDHKTRARKMYEVKLNRPWTGPWKVIKRRREVVY